jgi:hypothetical protein
MPINMMTIAVKNASSTPGMMAMTGTRKSAPQNATQYRVLIFMLKHNADVEVSRLRLLARACVDRGRQMAGDSARRSRHWDFWRLETCSTFVCF